MEARCSIRLSVPPRLVARVQTLTLGRDRNRFLALTLDLETQHAATRIHLAHSQGVARVLAQPGIVHSLHSGVLVQELGHLGGVLTMGAHADGQRPQATQRQPAVEWRGHRPHRPPG